MPTAFPPDTIFPVFEGWEVVQFDPTYSPHPKDILTLQDDGEGFINPIHIVTASLKSYGFRIEGFSEYTMAWTLQYIGLKYPLLDSKKAILWRKSTKRIYKPSIFAEPVPLP